MKYPNQRYGNHPLAEHDSIAFCEALIYKQISLHPSLWSALATHQIELMIAAAEET